MATRIRQPQQPPHRRRRLYLREWFDFRGLSDEDVAERLKKDRTTIWKWRTTQTRLDPDKIALLASVLDCEPEQLWRPPGVVSLDAMLKGASDEQRQQAAELVAVILKTGR